MVRRNGKMQRSSLCACGATAQDHGMRPTHHKVGKLEPNVLDMAYIYGLRHNATFRRGQDICIPGVTVHMAYGVQSIIQEDQKA